MSFRTGLHRQYFVTVDRGARDRHVVVKGRFVGNCIYIDEVALTDTHTAGSKTHELEMRHVAGSNPPRYEPA